MCKNSNSMYLSDVESYLNGESFEKIASYRNLDPTTIGGRITETFERLLNHFKFKELKHPYPCIQNQRGGKKFKNARDNKEFWTNLIELYRNGKTLFPDVPKTDSKPIEKFVFESICKPEGLLLTPDKPFIMKLVEGQQYRITIEKM